MPRGVPNRKTKADDADPAEQQTDTVDNSVDAVDEDATSAPAPAEAPEIDVVDDDSDATQPEPADESPLCPEHFPTGWPAGVTSAGCIHGQWERTLPAEGGS